jgi:hypothetical protein
MKTRKDRNKLIIQKRIDDKHSVSYEDLKSDEVRYISLAYWSNSWFRSLNLPGSEEGITYVVKANFVKYLNNKKIAQFHIDVFNVSISVNNNVFIDFCNFFFFFFFYNIIIIILHKKYILKGKF